MTPAATTAMGMGMTMIMPPATTAMGMGMTVIMTPTMGMGMSTTATMAVAWTAAVRVTMAAACVLGHFPLAEGFHGGRELGNHGVVVAQLCLDDRQELCNDVCSLVKLAGRNEEGDQHLSHLEDLRRLVCLKDVDRLLEGRDGSREVPLGFA